MAHSPKGFTGTVDQLAEARRFAMASTRFRAGSATDWVPTPVTNADRAVTIATGVGQACGVIDTTNTAEQIQFGINSTGTTRVDALVATWDWSSMTVAFRVIPGSSTPPAVNTTTAVDSSKINRLPGVQYDALVAIVRVRPSVGAFLASDITDMRVWGTNPLRAAQLTTYRSLLDLDPAAAVHTADGRAPSLRGFEFYRTSGTLGDGVLSNQGFASTDVITDTDGFYRTGMNFVSIPTELGGHLFDVSIGITLDGATSGRLFANLYRNTGAGLRAETYLSDTAWNSRVMRLAAGQVLALNAFQQSGGGNNKNVTGLHVSAWLIGT